MNQQYTSDILGNSSQAAELDFSLGGNDLIAGGSNTMNIKVNRGEMNQFVYMDSMF